MNILYVYLMKTICIIVGARPNLIKAFPIYNTLNELYNIVLIHTGQHYDRYMSSIFFKQLNVSSCDIHMSLENKTKAGDLESDLYINNDNLFINKQNTIRRLSYYKGNLGQLGEIRDKLLIEFNRIKPDMIIVFGDVTSTLAASLSATLLNIKLCHIESGLRSGDISMPEEVNRILTDHITDYFFVTEKSGVDNLQKEGIIQNVFLVGNTMIDTQKLYLRDALEKQYHTELGLSKGQYILITLHRPSNVDNLNTLKNILDDIIILSKKHKIIYPIHPRTLVNIKQINYMELFNSNQNIIFSKPLGYLEFTCLIANSKYVITDSGGIQEETSILNIPCFTLRPNTERPITLIQNNGTNQLIDKITDIKFIPTINHTIPLWDGVTSERIREHLSNIL